MSFIEILKVLVLGIVEGFTEWPSISSTGHLILVDKIVQFKQPEEFVNMFKVVIQLGAILAVLVMYFHRLNPFSKRKKPSQQRATLRLWMKIVVACLPAAVFGLLLDDWIDAILMDNAYVVSAMLILYGVLSSRWRTGTRARRRQCRRWARSPSSWRSTSASSRCWP